MRIVPLFAAGLALLASTMTVDQAAAQEPPAAATAPDPQMPPMPSMEGQQGDVSKPVTQIPGKKKGGSPVHRSGAKKSVKKHAAKPARSRKRR